MEHFEILGGQAGVRAGIWGGRVGGSSSGEMAPGEQNAATCAYDGCLDMGNINSEVFIR